MSKDPVAAESATADRITVRAWPDPLLERFGFDPRSEYVETFWLGILGPSTTWLLRRLAACLDDAPDGFELPLDETARRLGLAHKGGRHSPFARSLVRLCTFGLAQAPEQGVLVVRRHVPPLTQKQIVRLSPELQAAHALWVASNAGAAKAP